MTNMTDLTANKHYHCHYCGTEYFAMVWPRHCDQCGLDTYRNPLPVAVLLVPVGEGLLVVKRGIEPKKGFDALPGGYLECDESWQQGAVRELREETGIEIDSKNVKLVDVVSSPSNSLLVFCRVPIQDISCLDKFVPNHEVPEMRIIIQPVELAFDSHTDMVRLFFNGTVRP